METIYLIIASILIILGIIGSVLPIVPGPPISYAGLLITSFLTKHSFSNKELILMGVAMAAVTILDYVVQIYAVKKSGGGKMAMNGTVIGLIIGMFFFPPFGIILGPLVGAFLGANLEKDKTNSAPFKVAIGALLGFLGGTFIKLIYGLFAAYMMIDILILSFDF